MGWRLTPIDKSEDHTEDERKHHASDDRYVPSEEELQTCEDKNEYGQMT
jgi:hypothetical protein